MVKNKAEGWKVPIGREKKGQTRRSGEVMATTQETTENGGGRQARDTCVPAVMSAGDRESRRYYPLFWYGKTNYRNSNLYRNVKWSLENLKRRSTTISYVAIGSAWGR
ncbi:PREDICTED: uncharacterized protein LOC106788195 isoform X2 [Polistes canadensis]|uniref:uncharacterized protein LOC106788195 isoform X2 n=1 Tax=Polistes canadensis TaxID=91411 RepID=UPI000718DE90|nr:PREDICTED: uncharacterized protein LOC106788195 isoform X2 [Polistes canadensis]